MYALIAVAVLAAGAPDEVRLRQDVEHYWHLLEKRARIEAAAFVAPESLAVFQNRLEPSFTGPRIVALERRTADSYLVEVRVSRLIGNGVFEWPVVEEWRQSGDGWKVAVRDPKADHRALWSRQETAPADGLRVQPSELRLHFLSCNQKAAVVIRNGSGEAVRIAAAAGRQDLIVSPAVQLLEPGKRGRIEVRYSGDSTEKNLEDDLVLHIRGSGGQETRRIPVRFNYVSPGARALLGLDDGSLQGLQPGMSPTPAIQSGASPKGGGPR